ncbi:hypothetical protein IE077_003875 [Cardiosporidium cionae]|uniref:Uncharacterized protein n=1 Tax=Cardiosporidium cionae TaxID=476202 RepID=A0ABQ7J794_9APIC|nr:hypothetical protein IE077_003875 [Cardiosporidium cionae]|eukprot:KAF8819864.1 hypothetical protein IE077_003875 [Cardiosporidium cionae]
MEKNYENVIGGALRLKRNKGIAATLTHPLLKKQKKRKKKPLFEKDNPPVIVDTEASNESLESANNRGIVSDNSSKSQNEEEAAVDESLETFNQEDIEEKLFLTPSQRVFRAAHRQREGTRVDERLRLTHRQRIDKLNQHLSTLSEHFDIPKVGPG